MPRLVNAAARKLDTYDARLAVIELAEIDYIAKLPRVILRFDEVAGCAYHELDTDGQSILKIREQMELDAGKGDYPTALKALNELEKLIGVIQTTLAELDAAWLEYTTRLPGLISRFDSLMLSDFTELEDERTTLQTLRTAMETVATGTKYRHAVLDMNAIERLLNDLDAQMGNLINLQKQYLETYTQIKDGLDDVMGCDHPELKLKRTPIVTLRTDMLAAADKTDFATALEKARALIAPIDEFARLEVLLKEYTDRLVAITPRIKTALAFKYKSLVDDQKAITDLQDIMTKLAAKAELKDAHLEMDKLEDLVTDILALHKLLIVKEAIYNKLHADMQTQINAVKDNKIEKQEVKDAAKAVLKAYEEMDKLGIEEEFIKAVDKADEVKKLITGFLKAVDEFGDDSKRYETLKKFALLAYEKAKKKTDDYEALEKLFAPLETLKEKMEAAADKKKFLDAIAKAKELLKQAEDFEKAWVKLVGREAALQSAVDSAIARLGKLTNEDKAEAKEAYDKAKEYLGVLEEAIEAKKLNDADAALKKLLAKLEEMDEALKTKGESEAEYEGHRDELIPLVKKANESDFRKPLKTELDEVNRTFTEMNKTAGEDNFTGAVAQAKDVRDALAAFDAAEDVLEQLKVRLDERMEGLERPLGKLKKITHISLITRVPGILLLHGEVIKLKKANEVQSAWGKSETLRTDLYKILDDAEALEEKAEEEEEDDDDGIFSTIGDTVKDAAEYVGEKVLEEVGGRVLDEIGGKARNVYEIGKNTVEGVGHLLDGEFEKAAEDVWDIAKNVDDLKPGPDVVKEAMEVVEDIKKVVDVVEDYLDKKD